MSYFEVKYNGNSSRFKKINKVVFARNEREACEKVYSTILDENYFPDSKGRIFDCDKNLICDFNDSVIYYDGGCFYASFFINVVI